jgi:flagellar biosynthesis component FlhA
VKAASISSRDIAVPLGLLLVVGCILIPLPPGILDILLCSNLLFALLLVIGSLHIRDPLRIATLPSLLLMATLSRLSLNIATTRAVLGSGHAGKAVEAFGSVVIQGSAVVGFVLFVLITLIQFIVVAKGAERVAEVAARFTLDAMPGKQMAIDAELRSGLLDPEQARRKRMEVQTESRFYGALDGAMKFVKGDAIAGIVITAVNICGGLLIGILVHQLDLEVALRRYTILTIGDGLLSQIPSLLNSVAAGLVVTRVQVDESSTLSSDLLMQLGQFRAARTFVAAASFVLGCLPGMPHVALLAVSSAIALPLIMVRRGGPKDEPPQPKLFEPRLAHSVQLEVSKALLPCMPALDKVNEALEAIREDFFSRWGVVLQRPGLSLWDEPQGAFRILVRGMEVSRCERDPDAATWDLLLREVREVVDGHKAELIDDGATRRALDYVEKQVPDLVTGTVPSLLSLTQMTSLLRSLLREDLTTRHLDIILQTIAESGGRFSERALLAEVRVALAPVVSQAVGRGRRIQAVALDPLLDLALSKAEESASLLAGDLLDLVSEEAGGAAAKGLPILTSKRARAYVRDIVRVRWPHAVIIAHEEVAPRYELEIVGKIEVAQEHQREQLLSATLGMREARA